MQHESRSLVAYRSPLGLPSQPNGRLVRANTPSFSPFLSEISKRANPQAAHATFCFPLSPDAACLLLAFSSPAAAPRSSAPVPSCFLRCCCFRSLRSSPLARPPGACPCGNMRCAPSLARPNRRGSSRRPHCCRIRREQGDAIGERDAGGGRFEAAAEGGGRTGDSGRMRWSHKRARRLSTWLHAAWKLEAGRATAMPCQRTPRHQAEHPASTASARSCAAAVSSVARSISTVGLNGKRHPVRPF